MPRVEGVLETCLYVADMSRAVTFYEAVLGLRKIFEEGDRIVVLAVLPTQVLILFREGAFLEPSDTPGGIIPAHDGSGPAHLAFAVPEAELDDWRRRFGDAGVAIESEVVRPGRGHSLYFRDPDGHALELATPRLWSSLL